MIDFEDAPVGKFFFEEYASRGVHFGSGVNGFGSVQSGRVTAAADPNLKRGAHSGTHVADITTCGNEFCVPHLWGRFDQVRERVRVYVGSFGDSTDVANVTLHGFDVAGQEVATASTKTVTGGQGFWTQLAIDAGSPKIAFFLVQAPNLAKIAIDDLSFGTGVGKVVADYGLGYLGTTLTLAPGKQATATIQINRLNGWNKSLTFDATNLPQAVTASFSPNPVPSTAKSVELTLTAPAGVPGASGAKVVVSADPPGPTTKPVEVPVTVLGTFDVAVDAMEVTQGIQTNAAAPQQRFGGTIKYEGLPLVANHKTVVRVYASFPQGDAAQIPSASIELRGYGPSGDPLPAGPQSVGRLSPETVGLAPTMPWDPKPPWAFNRFLDGGAYVFTLPPEWTRGITIKLVATAVTGTDGKAVECDSPQCAANNTLTMEDVKFTHTIDFMIVNTVVLSYKGSPTIKPTGEVFSGVRDLIPTEDFKFQIRPYSAVVNIDNEITDDCPKGDATTCDQTADDIANEIAADAVEEWADDNGVTSYSFATAGVNSGFARGLRRLAVIDATVHNVLVVEQARPLTSVGHELFHALGRNHASPCTPKDDVGVFDSWPPDQKGYIDGLGLDLRTGPPYTVIASTALTGDTTGNKYWYDLMSYCASTDESTPATGNAWVAPRTWSAVFELLRLKDLRLPDPSASGAATPSLRVTGFVGSRGQVLITRVSDGPHRTEPEGVPTDYHVVLRDAVGRVQVDMPMIGHPEHVDPGALILSLAASVPISADPAAVPMSVEIQRGGRVLARRIRSASAPTVEIISPRQGSAEGRAALTTTVAWRAADADGGRVRIKIQYSGDDGQTWRDVYIGPNTGRVLLPNSFFSTSKTARVKVLAGDGMNETSAVSERFTQAGAPPAVRILAPKRRATIPADAGLYLRGEAYDDTGRSIQSALRWYDRTRQIGQGTTINAYGLSPGVHTIRLEARDAGGRIGSATVVALVRPVTPRFLELVLPRSLPARANRLSLRVASSVAARLDIRGLAGTFVSVPVAQRTRTLILPVVPGRTPLDITFVLTANGKFSRVDAHIVRR